MNLHKFAFTGFAASSSGAATMATDFAPYFHTGSASAQRPVEFRKLDRLAVLAPDWDGRGSEPPTARAIQGARFWLQHLWDTAASTGKPWTTPHLTASGSGELAFEWWRGNRKITIYFGDGPTPEFLKVWGPHIEDEMESGELDSTDAFRALWVWLNAA